MVRPSWSAEYKFAARDVRARWRAPLGIVAALTKNAQGHDTPIVPIKQAWRCAHDRQGQVAALPPSAALDDRYAQRPCEIRAGPRSSRKPVKQGDALAQNSLDTNRPIQVLGRKARLRGRLGKDHGVGAEAEVPTCLPIGCLRRKEKVPALYLNAYVDSYMMLSFVYCTLTGTKVAQRGPIWIPPTEVCAAFRVVRFSKQAPRAASR